MPELLNEIAPMSQERQNPSGMNTQHCWGGYECQVGTDLMNHNGLNGSGKPVMQYPSGLHSSGEPAL